MEPSVIFYWKNNTWKLSGKVFYSEDEINQWYKHNRSRIDGLSVVVKLSEKEATLARINAPKCASFGSQDASMAETFQYNCSKCAEKEACLDATLRRIAEKRQNPELAEQESGYAQSRGV